jgi:lipopolysaccharide biosynthesis glycosyltransferase
MDSDVIVRGDITELWNQGIEGHVIAAVLDDGIKTVSGEKGLPTWRNIGLEPDTPYFNSGVMLIDIDRWRDLAIGCRAMKYLETYTDQLVFADQDALNAVIAGDWRHLDPRWNVTSGSYRRYREAKFLRESEAHDTLLYMIDHPSIIHFTGPRKPWRPGCPHPLAEVWCQAFKRSGWHSGSAFAVWHGVLQLRSVFFRGRRRTAGWFRRRVAERRTG